MDWTHSHELLGFTQVPELAVGVFLIIYFSEWKLKCFVLQWHWIRQIFTYTETHADPEEVGVWKEFTCSFRVEDVLAWHYWPCVYIFIQQFLPVVPARGGSKYGLWEVPELRSDAAHSWRSYHSIRVTLLCKGTYRVQSELKLLQLISWLATFCFASSELSSITQYTVLYS